MMVLALAAAGGLGAAARFVVDGLIARLWRSALPLGTLLVNVTGSFLLGLVLGIFDDGGAVATVVGTGLLGGYTTFSTASVEAVSLALRGGGRAAVVAAGYAAVMVLACVATAAVGVWIG